MSRLDDLPPDQRAVLLLLVRQGKSHAEIAAMLGIPQDTVSDRARAALDALADDPGEHHGAAPRPARDSGEPTPSSRRGGALLLAGLVVIVVVVVILITDGGGSHKATSTQAGTATPASTTGATTTPSNSGTSTSGTATSSSTSKAGIKPTVDKQIALVSPEPDSKSVGLVEVFSEGAKHAFYIAAEHLPPSTGFFYAVWLYNSPTSAVPLSKSPPVSSNGRLQGGALLPTNAGDYKKILLTRETSSRPTHPGPIVLSGAFSLGG
ncbi:MAG TPA: sigma factor-like helix-turn-helix DNA-binding protein [Solirubrobacteraceae bacterium]|nr:sigma factor-like helix-turn-helix DNA-binding protein [Solirubrobacteraceae bacterium]